MIETRVEIKGLAEIDEALRLLPVEFQKTALRTGLRDAAKVFQQGMAMRAPRAEEHRVIRRGSSFPMRLAESIITRIRITRDGDAVAEIGPAAKAFWGFFQELGTRFQSPHPFMRPTFDADGQIAIAAFATGVKANFEALVRRVTRRRR